ncbi:MAG: hypothetical protein NT027_18155 [Proteobacteria bacterium]|nr:hypothetical protein [Pseudomonadota bacterium]
MKYKKSLHSFALILVFAILQGCVSNGREFPSRFEWLQKGKSRHDDVKLVLGEPQFVGYSDSTPSWTYGHYRYRLFGPSHTKELKIYWNPDKTVQSWSFTSSFPEDVNAVSGQSGQRPVATPIK